MVIARAQVMPDCHRGESAADQSDFMAWIKKFTWDAVIAADFERYVRARAHVT
jgi:hypothetical protein